MNVDLNAMGKLIDGYGDVYADDLHTRGEELSLLRAENARLRQALAELELFLTGLRGAITVNEDSDMRGGQA